MGFPRSAHTESVSSSLGFSWRRPHSQAQWWVKRKVRGGEEPGGVGLGWWTPRVWKCGGRGGPAELGQPPWRGRRGSAALTPAAPGLPKTQLLCVSNLRSEELGTDEHQAPSSVSNDMALATSLHPEASFSSSSPRWRLCGDSIRS